MTLDELESLGRRLEMIYESLLHEGRTTSATCVHEAQSALRVLWANKLDCFRQLVSISR